MTGTAFSTPESVSLERKTETEGRNVDFGEIWNEDHKRVCYEWIKRNDYKRVCLQFPDSLLTHSTKIYDDLMKNCDAKVFILADTPYGSCCVDEIAAAHVDTDSLIHFGYACRSKVSRLPVLYMFPQFPFNRDEFFNHLKQFLLSFEKERLYVLLDIGYHYILDDEKFLQDKAKENVEITVLQYPFDEESRNKFLTDSTEKTCIFVGSDNHGFFNLTMTAKASNWYIYDPSGNTLKESNPLTSNWIRRRYFYIEKCKDAKIVGLLVATLTSEGYLDVVKQIQSLAKCRGIKTHIISVGLISPEKLANFIEIDCFILIGCPFNNLYTSRDFFKPIVSVFEAEMALNPAWRMEFPETYVTNFNDILPNGKFYNEFRESDIQDSDVSLITGKMRNLREDKSDNNAASNGISVETNNSNATETINENAFEDRLWKGLDPALDFAEPAKIEKGLSGIPINYTHDE